MEAAEKPEKAVLVESEVLPEMVEPEEPEGSVVLAEAEEPEESVETEEPVVKAGKEVTPTSVHSNG